MKNTSAPSRISPLGMAKFFILLVVSPAERYF